MNKGVIIYNHKSGEIYGALFSHNMDNNYGSIYVQLEDNEEIAGIDLSSDIPKPIIKIIESEPSQEELKLENESLVAQLDYYQMKAEV